MVRPAIAADIEFGAADAEAAEIGRDEVGRTEQKTADVTVVELTDAVKLIDAAG